MPDIHTTTPAGLWPALADASQVENAILNLAVNARDAMPGGGRLLIEAANVHLDAEYARHNAEVTPGDYVAVIVTDTGTGMPPTCWPEPSSLISPPRTWVAALAWGSAWCTASPSNRAAT